MIGRLIHRIGLAADIIADRLLHDPWLRRLRLRRETISAWAARERDLYRQVQSRRIWGCILCRALDWIDRDHCDHALTGWGGTPWRPPQSDENRRDHQ